MLLKFEVEQCSGNKTRPHSRDASDAIWLCVSEFLKPIKGGEQLYK